MSPRYFWIEWPEQPTAGQRLLLYALFLSVTFALYGASLYFGFVWDDYAYISKNYRIQGWSSLHLSAIWTHTYLGHYAPVQHTFLAVLYFLSGMEPFAYHLGQILLHAACACLLYVILKKMESARVAFLTTLLFLVHPTNIETVAWISETKSTLAFLFFLLSFWAFLRLRQQGRARDFLWSASFLVFSLLAKINTVVAPAIFLLYDYRQGVLNRRKAWSLGALFLLSAVFTAIHLAAFHGSEEVLESTYYGGLGVHLMNFPLLVLFYLQMTLFPHPLSAWHLFPIQAEFTAPLALGWTALLALGWFLYRASRPVQFWGLWFLVFLAPVLQIVPFPIWVAERYLYIPAIGLFVLASRLFFRVLDRLTPLWQRWGWEVAMCLVVLALAWRTHQHLPVWKDDLTLWEATAPTCPTSAYCRTNLGLALLQQGKVERGIKELIQAVEIRPIPRYLTHLADAYALRLQDYGQARIAYTMALERGGPDINADFYAKLARYYLLVGDFDAAQRAIQEGQKLDVNSLRLWIIDGFLQWKLGNLQEARQSLRRALLLTQQRSNVAGLLAEYWGDPREIGRLLADLRAASSPASNPAEEDKQ